MTYIQTPHGKLLPAKDLNIPVNLSVAEIKDLSKRKGGYSKTIIINGSKDANVIFSHYYDVNITDATFDHKVKMPVTLVQDGIEIISGYLRLLKIKVESSTSLGTEQLVKYEVNINDATSSFFQDLGDKKLRDLDFSYMDHIRTTQHTLDTFTNTWQDGYKYIIPYNTSSDYRLNELNPGIFIRTYFDAIFATAGYTYEWADKDSNEYNFSNLIQPFTGKEIKPYKTEGVSAKVNDAFVFTTMPDPGRIEDMPATVLNMQNVQRDDSSAYNTSNGEYTLPVVQPAGTFTAEYNIKYRIDLVNIHGNDVRLENIASNPAQASGVRWRADFKLRRNGSVIGSAIPINDNNVITYAAQYVLEGGTTSILEADVSGQFTLNTTEFSIGDTFDITGEIDTLFTSNGGPAEIIWEETVSPYTWRTVQMKLVIEEIEINFRPSPSAYGLEQVMTISDFIDEKMKQRDLVKGVLNMFNLYAEINPEEPNKIVIQGRDKYYDSGQEHDWSKKLCTNKSQDITFSSEKLKKKFRLKYKDGKGAFNEAYSASAKREYGELEYTFTDEFLKGEGGIELPWESAPLVRTQDAVFAMLPSGLDPNVGLRIGYNAGSTLKQCNPFRLYESPDDYVNVDQFSYTGHFDNPIEPTFDLNFGVCEYYFYNQLNNKTNNNLYNLHWSRTIQQMENSRVLDAYFELSPNDINALKLNDRVWTKGAWWNILEIKDYNANSNKATKVKLITVDANQGFNEFSAGTNGVISNPGFTGITGVTSGGTNTVPAQIDPGSGIIKAPIDVINTVKIPWVNNIETTEPVQVIGTGNTVKAGVKNISVIGNNNVVNSSKNLIIGDNNVVPEDLEGAFILGDSITATEPGLVYTDEGGLVTRLDLTRAELLDKISNNEVKKGTFYTITDRNITLYGTDSNRVSNQGSIKRTSAARGTYAIAAQFKGVFNNLVFEPISTLGEIWVWGAKVWQTIQTGTPGAAIDEETLDPAYFTQVFSLSGGIQYYETAWFSCIYDIELDIVNTIRDNSNNIYYDVNGLYDKRIDYFNLNIWNNRTSQILNNRSLSIYDNDVDYIKGNVVETIYENSCKGYISGNRVDDIYLNSNSGDIRNNVTDAISTNSNLGSIYNNTNSGGIYFNSNNGNIYSNNNDGNIERNSNNGNIYENSNNGNIYENSNSGTIDDNNNGGKIENNNNNGNIEYNDNTNHIQFNQNNGTISNAGPLITDIEYNTNNGNIDNPLGPGVISDPVVNKQIKKDKKL